MDKYDVCAAVLLDAVRETEVDLEKHCDIYSAVGRKVATLLEKYATVNRAAFDSVATSEFGTPLSTEFGSLIQSMRITVRINGDGRNLAEAKTQQQIVEALKGADGPD